MAASFVARLSPRFSRMSPARMVSLVVVGAVMLGIGGCADGEDAASSTTTASSVLNSQVAVATTEAVATTAPPSTSVATTTVATTTTIPVVTPPTEPPVDIATTIGQPPATSTPTTVRGSDAYNWLEITRKLHATQLSLTADPPNANIGAVCYPDSECDAEQTRTVSYFVDEGRRVVQPEPEIARIIKAQMIGTDQGIPAEIALIAYVDLTLEIINAEPVHTVNRQGEIDKVYDPVGDVGDTFIYRWTLQRDSPEEPWRIASEKVLG